MVRQCWFAALVLRLAPRLGVRAPSNLGGKLPVFALGLLLTIPALPTTAASPQAPMASRALLLDVARAGNRVVAVGERGHLLLSDDEGASWRQVTTPTRAMLTGVTFGDPKHGWAVGHDATILATNDGGASWTRQDAAADDEAIFLDVHFRDALSGIAVGAYGLCRVTSDGGKTWTPASPSKEEMHFNAVAAGDNQALYLVGESGTVVASRNLGRRWRQSNVPYEGSLFGVLPLNGRSVLAFGMRGNVFASDDAGDDWEPREIALPVLLMSGVKLKSGVVVLAGAGGNFFISRNQGRTFAHWKPEHYNGGVAAMLETEDGSLLVVGELGAARLRLPLK